MSTMAFLKYCTSLLTVSANVARLISFSLKQKKMSESMLRLMGNEQGGEGSGADGAACPCSYF